MATLKRYADLGRVHRTEPCLEHPGKWLASCGGVIVECQSYAEARDTAFILWNQGDEASVAGVYWEASHDDPRIGEVWFTSFYRFERIDRFGQWHSV